MSSLDAADMAARPCAGSGCCRNLPTIRSMRRLLHEISRLKIRSARGEVLRDSQIAKIGRETHLRVGLAAYAWQRCGLRWHNAAPGMEWECPNPLCRMDGVIENSALRLDCRRCRVRRPEILTPALARIWYVCLPRR